MNIKETNTEAELKQHCSDITEKHQSEFDQILIDERYEYDAFNKFINLSERLMNSLTLAVNKFNPKFHNLLEIKYFRLTQYSVALEFRAEFHKRNSQKLKEKYSEPK